MTHAVFNPNSMKTVGERIRQAREYRGMSGETLALKVGYKGQSGISNLENRSNGRGGFQLARIAKELDFSLTWFLNGPDVDDLSQVGPYTPDQKTVAKEVDSEYKTSRSIAHPIVPRKPADCSE